MAQHDKDSGISIDTPNIEKNIDKPKGEMSIREAASREMREAHIETGMRGAPVHGFGEGQTDTPKRHTPTSTRAEIPMQGATQQGTAQQGAGETVTDIIDQVLHLPFHAQLSVLRMIAPRILGIMDARDREGFLRDLRSELGTGEEQAPITPPLTDQQDFQGT